jgi:uncharacterized protein (DUF4415 family)
VLAVEEAATAPPGSGGANKLCKQRVSIMLDASIIAFFKAKAGDRGYQTLINQAQHRAMSGEQIEAALRRVIREGLKAA